MCFIFARNIGKNNLDSLLARDLSSVFNCRHLGQLSVFTVKRFRKNRLRNSLALSNWSLSRHTGRAILVSFRVLVDFYRISETRKSVTIAGRENLPQSLHQALSAAMPGPVRKHGGKLFVNTFTRQLIWFPHAWMQFQRCGVFNCNFSMWDIIRSAHTPLAQRRGTPTLVCVNAISITMLCTGIDMVDAVSDTLSVIYSLNYHPLVRSSS